MKYINEMRKQNVYKVIHIQHQTSEIQDTKFYKFYEKQFVNVFI